MNGFLKSLSRILPAAGFSVLFGLCGVGLTWLAVAFLANAHSKGTADRFLAESMPILIAGGVVGVVVGLVASLIVLTMDPKREAEIEERYVGAGGRLKIYFGVPVFIMVLLAPMLRWLGRIVGQNADVYVDLGVTLVVIALSLVLYDHIPRRLVIPLAVIAWMLTLSLAVWFFFFGPGVFGHGG